MLTCRNTRWLSLLCVQVLCCSGFSAYAASQSELLPQCNIRSGPPFFQPDMDKPFFLAREKGNLANQYCNEESLLKNLPWATHEKAVPLKSGQQYTITKFRLSETIQNDVITTQFSRCNVTVSDKSWSIGACKPISDEEGKAILMKVHLQDGKPWKK